MKPEAPVTKHFIRLKVGMDFAATRRRTPQKVFRIRRLDLAARLGKTAPAVCQSKAVPEKK
jgi:hypothetical protein